MRPGRWLAVLTLLAITLLAVGVAMAQEVEGDPERGGELYVENCAMCHGLDGQGRIGANLGSFPGISVDSTLRQAIAEGIGGSVMPAWLQSEGGPLSDQEVDDIVAYIIQSFEGTSPIAPAPTYVPPDIPPLPDVEGDPTLGAVVYQANCTVCHGDQGQGRFGRPLGQAWPSNQPEVFIRQVVREGISGSVMPGWSQDLGGPLSEDDVDNVTAFILTLSNVTVSPTPAPPDEGPLSATVSLIIFGVIALVVVIGLIIYYRRA
jgi:cytochrome c oxidase cbb3-type subunit 3